MTLASRAPRLARWAVPGAIGLAVLGTMVHAALLRVPVVDDAAISIAYGQSFFAGAGLRLTPVSPPVEGFSNPLWVFMAMRMLRAKLYELEQERITSARDSLRRGQVGTGDRSEKIRTYNFPQDRLTDHRIGVTWHNLPARMAGDIEDIVVACRTFFQAEQLKAESTRPQPEA